MIKTGSKKAFLASPLKKYVAYKYKYVIIFYF